MPTALALRTPRQVVPLAPAVIGRVTTATIVGAETVTGDAVEV